MGPLQRMLMLVAMSIFIGGLLSLSLLPIMKSLYGISLAEDFSMLQDYSLPWIAGANKVVLAAQHLGFIVLPGMLLLLAVGRLPGQITSISFSSFGWILLLSLCSFPIINFLAYVNQELPLPESLMGMEENAAKLTELLISADSFGVYLLNVVVIALIPAIGEEFVFRGVIQSELLRLFKKPWLAIVFGAIIFATLHFQFAGFLPRFVLGLLLGYIYQKSGSLSLPILLHFLNNAVVLTLVYVMGNDMERMEEIDSFSWTGSEIIFLVIAVLGAFFLLKKKKWRMAD